MEHINNQFLGRQVGESFKWLCFLNYICLKTDKKFGGRLDDIQYILESVTKNKSRDISETANWWDRYFEDANCNEYATNLIKNIRNASPESRVPLSPQKWRSLSFYFAEFRGLAISLRAARDSIEHHVSQGASRNDFLSLYGNIALRIFEISKLLSVLVAEVAKANQEETMRFELKIVTASSADLEEYRLSASKIYENSSKDTVTKAVQEGLTQDLLISLLDEVQNKIYEQVNAVHNEIIIEINKSSGEIITALKVGNILQDGRPLDDGAIEIFDTPSAQQSLSRDELFHELLTLRDKIYSSLAKRLTGFEHWHNILQKPLIAEVCRLECRDFKSFKAMPGFVSRIIKSNQGYALKEQEELFCEEISQILEKRSRSE